MAATTPAACEAAAAVVEACQDARGFLIPSSYSGPALAARRTHLADVFPRMAGILYLYCCGLSPWLTDERAKQDTTGRVGQAMSHTISHRELGFPSRSLRQSLEPPAGTRRLSHVLGFHSIGLLQSQHSDCVTACEHGQDCAGPKRQSRLRHFAGNGCKASLSRRRVGTTKEKRQGKVSFQQSQFVNALSRGFAFSWKSTCASTAGTGGNAATQTAQSIQRGQAKKNPARYSLTAQT